LDTFVPANSLNRNHRHLEIFLLFCFDSAYM
jgi:hypothetical protein